MLVLSNSCGAADETKNTFILSKEFAEAFAKDWIDAWNSRDMERVLSHYREDFSMSSPRIVQQGLAASGTLTGKTAIREYWEPALQPSSKFEMTLVNTLMAVDSLTILYQLRNGRHAAEVFFFDDNGLVYKSVAHYSLP